MSTFQRIERRGSARKAAKPSPTTLSSPAPAVEETASTEKPTTEYTISYVDPMASMTSQVNPSYVETAQQYTNIQGTNCYPYGQQIEYPWSYPYIGGGTISVGTGETKQEPEQQEKLSDDENIRLIVVCRQLEQARNDLEAIFAEYPRLRKVFSGVRWSMNNDVSRLDAMRRDALAGYFEED